MSSLILTCGPIELRQVTARVAPQLLKLARDPELSTYLQWEPHQSLDDSLAYVNDTTQLWVRTLAYLPGIFDSASGDLVGATGVSGIDGINRRAEVGTWIGTPFQGQGRNLPSKAAVFTLGFDVLGLERLEMLVRADNEVSLHATDALPGVEREGLLRRRLRKHDDVHDAWLFAITGDRYDPGAYPPVHVKGGI